MFFWHRSKIVARRHNSYVRLYQGVLAAQNVHSSVRTNVRSAQRVPPDKVVPHVFSVKSLSDWIKLSRIITAETF